MKFSFKKDGGDGEKKPKAKSKSRGSGDGLASAKTSLANHGEKILLAVIGLISIYIIYSGFNREGISSTPDDVESEVQSARARIESPTWLEVKATRFPDVDRFDEKANANTIDIKVEHFPLRAPLHPVLQEERQKRKDPVVVAPVDLEVRPGYGALMLADNGQGGGGLRTVLGNANEDTRPLPDKIRERMGGRSSSRGPTESRYFISVLGLVPAKVHQDAFREALVKAIEYSIERDTPRYLAVEIERREMDPAGNPGQWVALDSPQILATEPRSWASKEAERVQSEHVIPTLMMPLPPIVMRDVGEWAAHTKIPQEQLDERGSVIERSEFNERGNTSFDENGEFSLFGAEESFDERANPDEGENGDDYGSDELTEADLRGQLKVEFGMFRFFDFDVVPGKAYQYRARLLLEDPNNPNSHDRPSANACETQVVIRRQATPDKKFVETPWSNESASVIVSSGTQIFAGTVTAPVRRAVSSSGGRISLPLKSSDEPVANVMGVAWDSGQKLDVPAPLEVRRGSLVKKMNAELEVVDPSISRVRTVKDYNFNTDFLVVDIAGGERLDRRGDLRSPGMVLVMDRSGNLMFHSELGDRDSYDFYEIPPDEEEIRFQQQQFENGEAEDDERGRGRGRGRRDRNRGGEQDEANEFDAFRGENERGGRDFGRGR